VTSIVDADDTVVATAWEVLEGDAHEGAESLRRASTEEGADFVYRIDPDVGDDAVDPDAVREDGEFPDADAVLWRANRDEVARELERREIGDAGGPGDGLTGDDGTTGV